jgi:alanine racemase
MSNSSNAGAILTIDLGALKKNYTTLAGNLASGKIACVVKANAYGLGVKEAAPVFSQAGCTTFFVATLEEGIELRQALPAVTIYIFHGVLPDTAQEFLAHNLIPVLNSPDQIEEWQPHADQAAGLHIDTGMSRLGLTPDECRTTNNLSNYNINLVMSHLACAEDAGHPKNNEQLALFNTLRAKLPAEHASLAASSGIFLGANFHFDLCRAGVSLYGVNPTPKSTNLMAQVVRLQAKILQIRSVDTPQTVGYGATHQATKPTKIATLAIGYADGYMRSLGNSGIGFIGDHEVPVVGRISMDLTTVDVTEVPDALLSTGTLVDLIGPNNPIDDVARQAGTIGYEVLTSLGSRFERRYISGEG